MKSLEEKASEVIKKIEYLNISSVTPDGHPWGTPVYTAYDKDMNFYWISWKDNQHSINLRNNPKAFVTIYDSTVNSGTGFGIYMEGNVEEVSNPLVIGEGILVLYKRAKLKLEDIKKFISSYPRRIYRFIPQKAWVNGDKKIEGSTIDTREEVSLENIILNLK
jgi:hypothetical protein